MPLSTRSGDPSEHIKGSCDGAEKAIEEFKDAASILNNTVNNMEDSYLPTYEGMNPQQVRKSLLRLINNGEAIIDKENEEEIEK